MLTPHGVRQVGKYDSGSAMLSVRWQALTNVNALSIDQSHRYGRHQAACREPAGSYDKTTRTAICFEHNTQYILIRAPYTHPHCGILAHQ